MRDQVIAQYHHELLNDPGLNEEVFARLKSKMRALRMLYGEREIGVALRPHFLTRQQYEQLATYSRLLASAMNRMAKAALEDEARLRWLGLTEREHQLALVNPGFSLPAIHTRVDGFVFGDQVRFVEYNAENPSSLTDQAGLNQILFDLPALQKLAERQRLIQFSPIISTAQSLLTTWQEWGGTGAPRIAILDWANLPTEHEFLLLRNYFASNGLPTIICTPDELEYHNGKLRRGDFIIDLVYKRVVIHEFLSRFDDQHPLIQAYLNHAICLINPFRCKIPHKKTSFDLLTDEANHSWFTSAELDAIHQSVPWTRKFFERNTTYQNNEIDLIPLTRQQRTNFVLKPNDDYGGRGIFFGNRSTESEWDEAIATALAEDYVVQELIDLHTEDFPIFSDTEWSIQPMYVDTNPFLFRGEPNGALVRLSDSPIVNVTSGGGETGFFLLEDDEA